MTQPDKPTIEEAMIHFGAKGMKWGVRKAEDTGGSSTSSKTGAKQVRREFKAKRFESKASNMNTSISSLNKELTQLPPGFMNSYKRKMLSNDLQTATKSRDRYLKDAESSRAGKMTTRQKHLVVGASVAAAVLVSYGAYKFTDSGAMNQKMIKGKEFVTGNKHLWKTKPSLSESKDVNGILRDIVPQINPNYGAFGTKMNCRRATFAYEMRRRGFDVSATLSHSGTGQTPAGLLNAINPKSKIPTGKYGLLSKMLFDAGRGRSTAFLEKAIQSPGGRDTIALPKLNSLRLLSEDDNSKTIFKALSQHPNGARGELGVTWAMGGGHSLAWEKIKGNVTVFDAQSGKHYSSPEDFARVAKSVTKAGFTRLDNVKLNDEFLMRWLKDAA